MILIKIEENMLKFGKWEWVIVVFVCEMKDIFCFSIVFFWKGVSIGIVKNIDL